MKKLCVLLLAALLLVSAVGCADPAGPSPSPEENRPGVEVLPVNASDGTAQTSAPGAPGQSGQGKPQQARPTPVPLPAPEPDAESNFGVDKNINVNTLDEWLDRADVCYRDVRMLEDPGDYASIGGDSMISGTVEGFEVVPYPYLANLTGLPPAVAKTAYKGKTLFTLTWNDDGSIASVTPNFAESEMIVADLFPKDKAIFLMCGGGGYAAFTKALLVELGYDPALLYNVGGFWQYSGARRLNVAVSYGDNNENEYYALHRLTYHLIDFTKLHPVKK